ncbi:MAG: biotin transporter BioY [Actinobacteria bacterium]|nr:biotin transporter BioY [Actinomycetota bacterium]
MNNVVVNNRSSSDSLTKIAWVSFFTALLILLSKISIPIPFSPVPFTLQVLGVLIIGLLMKPSYSFLIISIYLLAGSFGLPVFAKGGGLSYLLGPTGGFLFGFLISAPLIGFLRDRSRTLTGVIVAVFFGIFIIYLLGSLYLMFLTKKGFLAVLKFAVLPFIPFDLIKAFIAVAIYKGYHSRFKNL